MPLYLGHKNTKGLAVSPSLQSLKIDLLRASPSSVSVIARPSVTQPGYASYVNHLPAFMKAQNERKVIHLTAKGYVTQFPVDKCIPLPHPPLVIDYNGPPPAKHVEELSTIGFERIKMHKNENILRFPALNLTQVRAIKNTGPNTKTPSPANTVNLDAFDTWVMVLRIVSNLLSTHVYPAFRDEGHFMEEVEHMVSDLSLKRSPEPLESAAKRQRTEHSRSPIADQAMDIEESVAEPTPAPVDEILSKAKPPVQQEVAWSTSGDIPNTSGLFFPFVPELASYDDATIPRLFEDYLLQSLGNTPEQQIDRFIRIKSAWGIISKTESGNVMAHLCRIILLSLTSQARCFPIVQDGIYQGSVLSGGRYFVGLNGQIHRPLTFTDLQEETGSYHLHSRVLRQIAVIATGSDEDGFGEEAERILSAANLRDLRLVLMDQNLSENDRDEIRKLAVHLRFKNDSHLSVNPQTIAKVLDSMTTSEDTDVSLPMHYSALFSRDKVFVSLSAFGFQAPSFTLENCPKISLKDSKPPSTLVIRQKALDVATMDWKRMIESKEIKNNPRNLSKANRDRTIISNDKTMIWGKLKTMCGAVESAVAKEGEASGISIDTNDGLDDW